MAIALAACAAMQMANAQSAQNVLLISTNETTGGTPLYLNAIRAAYEAAGATVEDRRGVLSDATAISPSLFAGKDVVVVVSIYESIHSAHFSVLENAMKNRPNDDLAFVIYSDGCCEAATNNVNRLKDLLNSVTGWGLGMSARQYRGGGVELPLNATSPYASYFSHGALNPIKGHDYRVLTGAPAANVVYANTTEAIPNRADGAYTLFVSRSASNSGQGACVLFTGDASLFTPNAVHAPQRNPLGSAALALGASEQCKRAGAHAVPALDGWGLGLLSAAVAGIAVRLRRRARRQPQA